MFETMAIALHTRPSRTVPALSNWTDPARAWIAVSQVSFRRLISPGQGGLITLMASQNGSRGVSSMRANSAIEAANGDAKVVSVEPEEKIVEASETFRAQALVSSRAQV